MTVNKADAARVSGTANLVVDQTAPDPRLYHLSGTCKDGRTDRFDVDASCWPHPAAQGWRRFQQCLPDAPAEIVRHGFGAHLSGLSLTTA
jgi:hypothetical protein